MKFEKIRGRKTPKIGFGTWQLTGEKCRESVKDALELGYRHIDTAQYYNNEEKVGEGIRKSEVDREEVFLATKVWRTNLRYDDLIETTEESLRKLNTSYIDLLYIHWPNKNIELEGTLEAMLELKERDKVKEIGVSNFNLPLLKESEKKSDNQVFSNQIEYHPFIKYKDLLEHCRKKDILITAYSPLAKGKVLDNHLLQELGKKYNKTPAQISLKYLIQQENVVAIPKASKSEHRKQNLDIFDFNLRDEEMEEISSQAKGKKLVSSDFSPW